MPHVNSADGTSIGYDRPSDEGPTLVLIGGGLDDGTENRPLGEYLGGRFSVVNYRRRGRGESGDRQPYAVAREIDDLAAVIDATGGRAHLFGASSGGALALEAAAAGLPVDRIAVHEVPYLVDDTMVSAWQAYRLELDAALGADDHDQALRLFMRLAGSSEQDIAGAEAAPVWPALRALAPTLRYDAACLGDGPPPANRLATIRQPMLLTTGITVDPHMAGLPVDFFGAAADAAATALPNARRDTLKVEGHVADPAVLGPILSTFFTG
ncbi:alpha/beta hydrolase [Actinoplanes italicus]|uniref:Pimeloyl-ACP methyl ester carboxylesterase n=1 Tax=Actinoplanes italicus TaxID=113567 RepID=A0A2T0JZ84_9ACTN|nr:alpha/beta fold hydrolase [Actinoplanes italicus]PRX15818.1 pimeloyl-ACP methyl ester carboxylesterase [Actinoplanes italicus]GIE28616.1 alpha/beta hydrolase [Actinoplanes italicus]